MKWSKWYYFNKETLKQIPTAPGIYRIRCFSNRKPLKIQRPVKIDINGLTYIGKGSDLHSRLSTFWRNCNNSKSYGHIAGVNYALYRYSRLFPINRLQYQFKRIEQGKTKAVEKQLLNEYLSEFLDLPPLNFSV